MLKEITLKNFKPYADATLSFSPGLNIIVGADGKSTDTGKSAFFKALSKILVNDISNTNIIKRGTKGPCIIEIVLIDETVIRYTYTGTASEWYLKRTDGTDQKWPTAAQPDEIKKILNLSELNFQKQKDVYFLVNETPGKVAKIINDAAGLGLIDTAIKKAASLERDRKKEVQLLSEQLIKTEDALEEFANFNIITDLKNAISDGIETFNQKTVLYNTLTSIQTKYFIITTKLKNIPNLNSFEKESKKLRKKSNDLKEKINFVNEVQKLKLKITNNKELLNLFVELPNLIKLHIEIKQHKEVLIEKINKVNSIKKILKQIESAQQIKQETEIKINKELKLKNQLTEELSYLLTNCPLCGQQLTSDLKHKVKTKLCK